MKKKYYLTGADRNVSWFWYAVNICCKNGNFLLLAKKKAWTRWIFVELLMILDDIWRRGKYEKLFKILPKERLPLGASLLKAVPAPPQLFCFKLLHQPCFIYCYFNTQGISFIAEANNKVKRGQNNSKTRNHSPSIRLKGFESARILWRSSLSSSRQFSSSSMSMLWRPSQSSLISSSNCYVKALIWGMETASLICSEDLRLL